MKDSTKTLLFVIFVVGGFALILFGVPRLINFVLSFFGMKFSRAILLLFVALCWYLWGEFCVRVKNKYRIGEEDDQ